MIHLSNVLATMKDRDAPFSIKFVTHNANRKTGGEMIHLDKGVKCNLPYESKQHVGIKQLGNEHHPFAVHQRLITEFNGAKVFW